MFRGHYTDAVSLRRRSAAFGDKAGLISKGILDHQTIAFVGVAVLRDVDVARDALQEVRARIPHSIGTERAYVDFYEAVLARETGDAHRAIRLARRAERIGNRLADSVAADALQMRAAVLSTLGRHHQVEKLYFEVSNEEPRLSEPCAIARLLGNRAWATHLAESAGVAFSFDVLSDAKRAKHIYETTCPDPANVFNLDVTLALAALRSNRVELARVHLESAARHRGGRSTEARAWLLIAQANLALAEGRYPDAERSCDALEKLGLTVRSTPFVWRAELCRARLWGARGNSVKAVEYYEAAEKQLDSGFAVPFAGPGLRFDSDLQDAAAREHAELLMHSGDARIAEMVLNRHALRSRRGLERGFQLAAIEGPERRGWERAALQYVVLRGRLDELEGESWADAASESASRTKERAEIEDKIQQALVDALTLLGPSAPVDGKLRRAESGEVVVTIDRLLDDWVAFVSTGDQFLSVRFPQQVLSSSEAIIGERLFSTTEHLLNGASSVRVVARGRAHRVDVHSLPFNGMPLIASHVVYYSVDGRGIAQKSAKPRTLVAVEDPGGNLPSARDEVRRVVRDLHSSGWGTTTLSGRRVTRSRLNELLDEAALLHWAGHGVEDPEVGFSAALPLAGRAILDVGDILALPGVPEKVVLSGCETAPPDSPDIGPARAFVLAGAREVLATTRPVRDSEAAAVTGNLYREFDRRLGEALQRVQIDAARRRPDLDWAAFRVYVP